MMNKCFFLHKEVIDVFHDKFYIPKIGLFELQMIFSFPFLRAKDLRRFYL